MTKDRLCKLSEDLGTSGHDCWEVCLVGRGYEWTDQGTASF